MHPQTRPLKILIIENDPGDAELSLWELKRAGLEVNAQVIQTPEEFKARYRAGDLDLILADYNLPGWTGMDALEMLLEAGLDIPFILVTGAMGEEAAVAFLKRGLSDYVLKDRIERLPISIAQALEEKRLRLERARAMEALRQSEVRFRALIDNSADGVALVDPRGRVMLASHTMRRLLGAGSHAAAGKNFLRAVHLQDRGLARRFLNDLARKPGVSLGSILRLRAQDMQWRWLECIGRNLFHVPCVQGIVINFRNVTERVKADEEIRRLNAMLEVRVAERTGQLTALNRDLGAEIEERRRTEQVARESQERFRLLVDGVKDYAIMMLAPDGHLVSWNAGAERISGYEAKEAVGLSLASFYTQEEQRAGIPGQQLKTAVEAGRFEQERWYVCKDGSRFWANVVITPLFHAEYQVRGFSVVVRDITERRAAEEALQRLRLQTELILNSAGEGILGLDRDGHCTFLNPAAARMLGWAEEEVAGQHLDQFLIRTHADGAPIRLEDSQIKSTLAQGAVRHVEDELFWKRDGACFPAAYTSTPIRNAQSEILGAVVSFLDITERRAVERMKDEFVSMVSHELRTPLTSIRGALGLLSTGRLDQQKEKWARMLSIAVSNTDRLVRLIDDILDLERMESGRVTMARRICSVADLMSQAGDLMRLMAEKKNIRLQVAPLEDQIWGDPDRVLQVLTNLMSNAIKFSSPGGSVSLSAKREEDFVTFQVEDDGRGIPEGFLQTIFERFKQVDASDSREKGGTGLGLAICQSIVKQHGGRIWVESEQGRGSRFTFSIPMYRLRPHLKNAAHSCQRSILLYNEGGAQPSSLADFFAGKGFRVKSATGCARLAEEVDLELPGVIVLEMESVSPAGLAEFQQLRQRWKQLPISTIAYGEVRAEQGAGMAPGFSAWIQKVDGPEALLREIEIELTQRLA